MDDLISRQAAIDKFKTLLSGMEYVRSTDEAKERVARGFFADIPSESSQQWIPVSETNDMPEHEVLCCDEYGHELIGWLSCKDEQWLCESEGEMMYDVIAWCELLKPYKERNHEL